MKLLVTGGCGFIGSNFIMHMLESYPDISIINLDLLTYAGNLENLQDTAPYADRYGFVRGDIADRELVCNLVCTQTGRGSQFRGREPCRPFDNGLFRRSSAPMWSAPRYCWRHAESSE